MQTVLNDLQSQQFLSLVAGLLAVCLFAAASIIAFPPPDEDSMNKLNMLLEGWHIVFRLLLCGATLSALGMGVEYFGFKYLDVSATVLGMISGGTVLNLLILRFSRGVELTPTMWICALAITLIAILMHLEITASADKTGNFLEPSQLSNGA